MKKYFFILLFFLGVTLAIFFGTRIKKQQAFVQMENESIFEQIIFRPIPGEVTDIHGFAKQTGKADTFFRFTITPQILPQLLQLHDYKPVDCSNEAVFAKLFAPRRVKGFVEGRTSFWKIQKVEDKVCYATFLFTSSGIEGKLYSNNLRQKAQSELLIDQKNNRVYFHESGI